MRNIKFRGKRKDNGEWVYGDLITNPVHHECVILENGVINHSIDPETVGQFTGLKDKNGVEIYEGDKLRGFQKEQDDKEGARGFEVIDTVYWHNGGFNVFSKSLQSAYSRNNNMLYQFMWCSPASHVGREHYYQIDDIEIIGNIHDVNPASGQAGVNHMLHDPNVKTDEQATNEGAATAGETMPEGQPMTDEGKGAEE